MTDDDLSAGPTLALLLLGGWRRLVDQAVEQLAEKGFSDVRPAHDFAMRAIEAGADTASDLGRRMAITKQAAAKVIDSLLARGYVVRTQDPDDARRKPLSITPLGAAVMSEGAQIFDDLRARLEEQVGTERFRAFEDTLRTLVGDHPVQPDSPGWVADIR